MLDTVVIPQFWGVNNIKTKKPGINKKNDIYKIIMWSVLQRNIVWNWIHPDRNIV